MANATSTSPRTVGSWALWFGFIGGIAAWAVFLLSGFATAYVGCLWGLDAFRNWLYVLTAVFVVIAGIATAVAFRNERQSGPEADSEYGDREYANTGNTYSEITYDDSGDNGNEGRVMHGRIKFIATLGAWLSVLSVMMILMTGIAIVWLIPCG